MGILPRRYVYRDRIFGKRDFLRYFLKSFEENYPKRVIFVAQGFCVVAMCIEALVQFDPDITMYAVRESFRRFPECMFPLP